MALSPEASSLDLALNQLPDIPDVEAFLKTIEKEHNGDESDNNREEEEEEVDESKRPKHKPAMNEISASLSSSSSLKSSSRNLKKRKDKQSKSEKKSSSSSSSSSSNAESSNGQSWDTSRYDIKKRFLCLLKNRHDRLQIRSDGGGGRELFRQSGN